MPSRCLRSCPPLAAGPLLAALALTAVPGLAEEPRISRLDDGALALEHLPPLLADEQVREELDSGLTTTFLLELRPRGGSRKPVGAARMEIRYELWDEVYLVTARGADGEVVQRRLASFEELAAWWGGPALVLTPPDAADPEGELWLDLSVIPFSRSEQRDAQEWLTRSLADPQTGRSAAEGASDAADEGFSPLDRLFEVLIATSISRRSSHRYRWAVTVQARGP